MERTVDPVTFDFGPGLEEPAEFSGVTVFTLQYLRSLYAHTHFRYALANSFAPLK